MKATAAATAPAISRPPARTQRSAYAIQRAKWIRQGLCAIDGKAKIWKGHSSCECKKHFLYYKAKAKQYAAAKVQPAAPRAKATFHKRAPVLEVTQNPAEMPAQAAVKTMLELVKKGVVRVVHEGQQGDTYRVRGNA